MALGEPQSRENLPGVCTFFWYQVSVVFFSLTNLPRLRVPSPRIFSQHDGWWLVGDQDVFFNQSDPRNNKLWPLQQKQPKTQNYPLVHSYSHVISWGGISVCFPKQFAFQQLPWTVEICISSAFKNKVWCILTRISRISSLINSLDDKIAACDLNHLTMWFFLWEGYRIEISSFYDITVYININPSLLCCENKRFIISIYLQNFPPQRIWRKVKLRLWPRHSVVLRKCCPKIPTGTVDGSEIQRSPVEVGSFSHHLHSFFK